jgi:molybdopterin-guanine dinucleotide biosynthesis protein A
MEPLQRAPPVVAGIFVGGTSSRMGGRPKGLLLAPGDPDGAGETIVARWRRMFDALGVASVLVGERTAYAGLGMDGIDDDPAGIGPLGGLVALLKRARGGSAIVVACDMPYVSLRLLTKLASHPSAGAVAARRGNVWEPLFARYTGPRALEIAERNVGAARHGLYAVLDALGADALPLSADDWLELRDWDTPGDAI